MARRIPIHQPSIDQLWNNYVGNLCGDWTDETIVEGWGLLRRLGRSPDDVPKDRAIVRQFQRGNPKASLIVITQVLRAAIANEPSPTRPAAA
jgi:hypothetical protein